MMRLRALLAARGIHYLATRFGWPQLRSRAFDAKYLRGDWAFTSESHELSTVIETYVRGGDLLVMGCGSASILSLLKSTAMRSVLGIDLSGEAIKLASRFASETFTFRVANMMTFEYRETYDVILFSESINYVPRTEILGFLRRLTGHLKPGGTFVVTIAEPTRYRSILEEIRQHFLVLEDRHFSGSTRYLIVFGGNSTRALA